MSASTPLAVFSLPVVLLTSVLAPLAVLLLPLVLLKSAPKPVAVLLMPLVLKTSALSPIAVLLMPPLFRSASSPRNVLELELSQPSLQVCARAVGESASHARARASGRKRKPRIIHIAWVRGGCCLRGKPRRKGSRLIEFLTDGIVFVSLIE